MFEATEEPEDEVVEEVASDGSGAPRAAVFVSLRGAVAGLAGTVAGALLVRC